MKTHGISIGIERNENTFMLKFKAKGKLTHEDYNEITPLLNGALEAVKNPIVYALFDVTEMEGWEPRAAWDDFKLGLKHRHEFKKVALYGSKNWQKNISSLANLFIAGEVEFFEKKDLALAWICEK
ncbi:MAG: STAS/SEC14 domain-containing protein [Halobacteriovoraceae bacterium]|nr:STAS/SEC14 domain-containing protein [Halobacteriovoraceae bacterium]